MIDIFLFAQVIIALFYSFRINSLSDL